MTGGWKLTIAQKKAISKRMKGRIVSSQVRRFLSKLKTGVPNNVKEKNPMWKGDKIFQAGGRQRARRWFKLKNFCENCGAKAKDRHHKDGNPLNNSPENILSLCRKCHVHIDGRIKILQTTNIGRRYC